MKKIVCLLILVFMIFNTVSCAMNGDDALVGDTADSVSQSITEAVDQTLATMEVGVENITPQDTNYVKWFGRTDILSDGAVGFDYTASGFEVKIRGSRLDLTIDSTNYDNDTFRAYVAVIVDGEDYGNADVYALDSKDKLIKIELEEGEHTVKVLKRSEAMRSRAFLRALDTDGVFLKPDARKDRYIEFYGDSITCGYGNMTNDTNIPFTTEKENGLGTYAFMSAEALDAECSVISQSGIAVNKNINLTNPSLPALVGKRSYTDSGEYKSDRVPDAVVIYGGVNDLTYIRAATDTAEKNKRHEEFVDKYVQMLEDILNRYPGVTVFCCSNMYSEGGYMGVLIKQAISKVGSDSVLYVSLPAKADADGVGSQGHPTYKTHQKAAQTLTQAIRTKLGW